MLIEPALITREVLTENLAEREGALKAMNIAVSKRKDEWKTRVDARVYFENRFPWQMWDTRVFELFVVSAFQRLSHKLFIPFFPAAIWS